MLPLLHKGRAASIGGARRSTAAACPALIFARAALSSRSSPRPAPRLAMMASRSGGPASGIASAGGTTPTRVASASAVGASATAVEAPSATMAAAALQQQQQHQREAPPPPAPAAGPPFSCPAIQLWEARRRAWRAGTLRMQPAAAEGQQQQQHQSLPRYRGGAARRGAVSLTPDEVLGMEPFVAPVPLADVIEALLEAWEEESY